MRRRVLVVEDNDASRELLCDWLEAEGFEALGAENLEQGFEALRKLRPAAMLLDVQLGEEDGLKLAEWLRKEPEHLKLPVIAVTAHAMVTDQERVLEAGCAASLAKPVDFKVLRKELKKHLRKEAYNGDD